MILKYVSSLNSSIKASQLHRNLKIQLFLWEEHSVMIFFPNFTPKNYEVEDIAIYT